MFYPQISTKCNIKLQQFYEQLPTSRSPSLRAGILFSFLNLTLFFILTSSATIPRFAALHRSMYCYISSYSWITQVSDLYLDLRDGRSLLKLLEVLSGDKWAKPSRGTMRFHQLENNEKVFSYLKHAKVTLSLDHI